MIGDNVDDGNQDGRVSNVNLGKITFVNEICIVCCHRPPIARTVYNLHFSAMTATPSSMLHTKKLRPGIHGAHNSAAPAPDGASIPSHTGHTWSDGRKWWGFNRFKKNLYTYYVSRKWECENIAVRILTVSILGQRKKRRLPRDIPSKFSKGLLGCGEVNELGSRLTEQGAIDSK